MKSLLSGITLTAALALVACGPQGDPEAEQRYTDSLANVRYEERSTLLRDSLNRSCEEQVADVQRQIDSLNTLIENRGR